MSNDTVMTVTVKGIGDFSDVVSNVGSIQKALTKLKLPDKLGDSLNKNITNFYKEYEKYQKKISEGIKTQGDYNQVEKSLNNMRNLYQAIGKDAQKLTELDMKDILNLDTGEFKKIMDEMTSVMKQIGSVKIDTSPFTKAFKDIQGITKNSKIVGEDGLLNKIIGSVNTGQIAEAKKQLQELQNYAKKVAPRTTADGKQAPGTLSPEKYQQLTRAIDTMNGAVTKAETAINPLIEKHNNLQKELDETKQKAAQSIKNEFKGYNQASGEVEKLTDSLRRMHEEEFNFNREAQNIDRQIQSYFGLSQMIRKVGDIARDAFATVKELDKAMTETAVVTNFSVGDMWDMLPTYTQQANQLGSTIRDVYEAATLYYQQGLNTNQAMSLANETLKMARIAGLDAAEATNMMTAALRGFNMEINQQSAQKINDIYSELAAITASDTKEIGSAMERTASIANSANMEFATTSAFLAQMIETTREAPENLGTAMKTIVARFQEMKQDPTKLVDSEGVAMDANKVDKALKTIGVNLMNTKGEFRDLDDVFLDISQRWDSLTQGQQRYIATIAAGSRQQSRFIAMMSNYERTMELVDAANNSAGASQRQFEKTLDSMEAKLNKLKNAWDQFTMGLMNNQILKFGVDALTEGFTIVNKFIDILGKLPPKPFEGITKSALTLITTLGMLNFGKRATRGLVMGGAGWFKGETSLVDGFKQGWKSSGQTGFFKNKKSTAEAEQQGVQDGQAYGKGWARAVQILQTKQKTGQGILSQTLGLEQFKKNKAAFGSDSTILNSLFPKGGLDDEARRDAQDYLNTLRQELNNGKITKEQLPTLIESGLGQQKGFDNKYVEDVAKGLSEKKIKAIGSGFDGMTSHINSAGVALSNFGSILQGTPLEPFGQIIGTVGGALISLSTILATTKAGFLEQWAAATVAAVGEETEAGAALTAAAANGTLTVSSITAAGGMATLATAIGAVLLPLLAIAAIIGVVVGAYKLLDAAIETNKEKIESATDAAAAASEAYDSAKQETSELSDAIEQVKTNEDAFDGLVVGTVAFNEQLVTANDQIMELIKKYPMLNDYLTTDKNGLMHISNEGLEAVKEYQKQRQANASALNLIQTADLNSEETRQKAEQMRKTKGTDTRETLEQRKKEADLLEQQAEAQQQMAKLNAVNTALVDKEIGNREKVSAIMADQYDARRDAISLEGESIHDLKQEYADFYGYTYDKSTKKIKDVEGNEIDVSDDTVKDAVKDIRVITDIEVDAGSVDTAISSIDRKFSKHFKGDGNFFSDILSDNIETNEDLLREILQDPGKLQETVSELSSKEIAAIMGVSADAVDADSDKYSKDLINKLTEKAENIAEAQSEAWGEFGAMLAQAEGMRADAILDGRESSTNLIQRQLTEYTAEQRDLMVSIGKSLESGAGVESMKSFIRNASDIYREGTEKTINELNGIIKGVNWDSPTARLKAYKDLTNSTTSEIQKMGQELLESTDSANLLGEAFEEFYNSSDWAELSENMDNFVDSTGKVNAVGVEEMAKQCNSLNNLLDTGAISAGGVAAAINALGVDGELTLLDLNSAVLQLLSTFGQLDNIIGQAHQSIENFDWGIDTGESADFVKESAEKWNELYEGGEVGNPQLEAYAKYVLGEENYIKKLNENHGDLQATMEDVSKYVNEYANGFDKAWDSLANGSWQGKVPKELQDLNISFDYDDNGNWEWDPGSATTEQLSEWLQAVKGIGPEMAAAMIEDWQNYSPDFRAERQKNDFYAGLDNYIAQRSGDNGVTITTNELDTIAAATGESVDDVRAAIIETAEENGQKITEIDNTVEGITSEELNAQYNKAKTGDVNQSWIQGLIKTGSDGEKQIDASQAITQAIGDGFTQAQAETMAYDELSKAVAEGTDVWYKDKLLTPEDLASFDNFKTAIEDFENSSQWVEVGKAIAEGVVSYIEGKDNPKDTTDNSSNKGEESTPKVDKPSQQGNRYTDTGTGGKESYTNSYSKAEEQQYSRGIVAAIKELIPPLKEKNEPTELTPAQQQKTYGASSPESDKTDESSNNLQEAATKLQESGTQIETAATKLETGASKVESAATKLETAASNLSKPEGLNSKNSTIPNGSTIPGVGFVSSNTQSINGSIDIETANADTKITELQTKLKDLNDLVNQGGTYDLKVSGISDIRAAATAAKSLTKNSGVKTIGVKTGKADTSSVDKATKTIGNTEAKIKVGAVVDSAIAAARRAQRTINGMSATIDVDVHVRKTGINSITVDGKTITVNTAASGKHNHGYAPAPSFGSAARGRYGQVGPKGKGGLTLTGELGYEVAWLPDENRSMILGANGPQMIDLPGNAVVWDHEQSKKIVKQKAIPAGSHSRSTRPGNNSSVGGSTDSYSQTISNQAQRVGDKIAKDSKDALKAVARVTVWWENAARRAEAIQRKADKNQNAYEKYLKDIQATLKGTGKAGGNQFIKNSEAYISEQQRQFRQARNELRQLSGGKWQAGKRKGKKATSAKTKNKKYNQKAFEQGAVNIAEISYEGKNSKGKKVNITRYVDLSEYIYKDKNGAYQVSQSALNKVKNKDRRRAIADAANKEVNDRISKKNAAEDNIKKAQEALEKFSEELYENFFAWETELTKIQNITQQIDALTSKIGRKDAMDNLINAQIKTGYLTPEEAKNQTLQNFNNRLSLTQETITKRREAINQSKSDLADKASGKNIQDAMKAIQKNLATTTNETKKLGYEKALAELQEQQDIYNEAQKYVSYKANSDGTYKVNFDTARFEKDKAIGLIGKEMGEGIQEFAKSLEEGSQSLDDLYQAQTEDLAGLYENLDELQTQRADLEEQLIEINQEASQKEIDQLKALSDGIKKAIDNLLNEVKRKLDERRKQEENQKTEQDISRKQQRLAALRADTSGGHQVEIAQLEKEIADAQNNYQQSLEDQLLERMQTQADEAAQQRERQIELQETLATGVNNILEVQKWMAAPQDFKDDILKQYRKQNNYDEQGEAGKAKIDSEFATFFTSLMTNEKEREVVFNAIEANKKEEKKAKQEESISTSTTPAPTQPKEVDNTAAKKKAQSNLDSAWNAYKNVKWGDINSERTANTNLINAAKEAKKYGINTSNYSVEKAQAAFKPKTTSTSTTSTASSHIPIGATVNTTKSSSSGAGGTGSASTTTYSGLLAARASKTNSGDKYWGKIGKDGLKDLFNLKGKKSEWDVLTELANYGGSGAPLYGNWEKILNAYIDYKGTKKKAADAIKDNFGKNLTNNRKTGWKKAFGKDYPSYKKGGLADFTGPAWLDGTPSKPELVLNAKDTQNFIALRDVLSKALGSTNSVSNSYAGDVMYEININVDKIEKDYDVDRVAERVKKIIVKDSGYRNVTQVRNFR